MIRMTTRVCHSKSLVEENDRQEVAPVLYQKQRDKMDAVPAISKRRRYVIEEREEKLKGYAESCPFNEIEMNDTKIGIIAAGAAYLYAKEALGDKASYLKLGFTYPLPMEKFKTFSDNFDELYDVETVVKALGIKHVRTVNPLDLKAMKETLDWAFAMEDEPSVIITKWPCVLKKYSKEDKAQFNLDKTPCVVDADKCIGCKKCLSTGCPALRYDSETKKSSIAQADCVGCTVCMQVCPVQAISRKGDK